MKKGIRVIIVCLFCIVLILVGKNVLKGDKKREYIRSDEYYEEYIEDININEVTFHFLQVREVANLNSSFYKIYNSYKDVVVGNNEKDDVFEQYANIDTASDPGCIGIRYYLNEDESPIGACFTYAFEYEKYDGDTTDASIEIYITDESLEEYEGLLPAIEEADEGNVYSIYDNIFLYMEGYDNMDLFATHICTIIFDGTKYYYFAGVIDDGEKECYYKKYCSIIYEFLQQIYQ